MNSRKCSRRDKTLDYGDAFMGRTLSLRDRLRHDLAYRHFDGWPDAMKALEASALGWAKGYAKTLAAPL